MQMIGTDGRRCERKPAARRFKSKPAAWRLALLWSCALALLAAHAQPCAAQTTRQARPARPRTEQRAEAARAVELTTLVTDARALPAEYAADALLRLVEADKIKERAWRRELLEEAFRTAGGAQRALKRRIAPGLTYAYTREDYEARAEQLNLDALSLRLRAVNALLKSDKPQARALFAELPTKLPLAPLTCADALVYDVSGFYETLGRLARAVFTPEEQARGADVQFVQAYIEDAHAPAQLWPLAPVVAQLGDTRERLAPLVHAYSAALARIRADDRSFTADLDTDAQAALRLFVVARERGLTENALLEHLRGYFTRHLHAERCADSLEERRRSTHDRLVLKVFNGVLREADPSERTLPPITAEEVAPTKTAGAARLTPYFTTTTAASLFNTAQELRFGLSDAPEADDDERADAQRTRRLTEWLNAMADWRGEGEPSEADYFTEKCVLYQLLLEVAPGEGPAGETLLRQYVAFLRQPARQQEARALWLMHVQRLLASPRFAARTARPRLRAVLNAAGDPVLRLYTELDAARSQTPPAP